MNVDTIMHLFQELQQTKMMTEKQAEQWDESAKAIESINAAVIGEIAEIDAEYEAIERTLRKCEAVRGQLINEEDKLRDIRGGTRDELESESAAFHKVNNDYNSEANTSTTAVFNDSKRAKEMHSFYDANRCTERMPEFQSQIISKQHDLSECLKQVESFQNKFVTLAIKKDAQREVENRFPNETVRQFMLKEGKKQRHFFAKEVHDARYHLYQQNTDEREVLTQGSEYPGSPLVSQ